MKGTLRRGDTAGELPRLVTREHGCDIELVSTRIQNCCEIYKYGQMVRDTESQIRKDSGHGLNVKLCFIVEFGVNISS